ncbi:hypothetical protein [Riemerella columbina]|uniref:hypothetical protein n=1 Tax=Riemerella columbina TaxID=103810 RepID=UPI00037A46F0|nr:hypothetical protein [Riemerella columbina]
MENKKNILIVTYYWPPAGGPGVQRWLKFVKYLPEFGWNPIVYTPENPSYPLVDDTLVNEVADDLDIIKTKIWEPYHIAEQLSKRNKKFKSGQFDVAQNQSWKSKLSIWIRGNFFIPDARVFWVNPSVKYLKRYLEHHKIDTLVTTGPPHSMHLIGLKLKEAMPHLKWIADFRDPWTEISYYKYLKLTRFSDRKHHRLEQQVFKNADITLATSYTDAEKFKAKGANAFCITNGFDERPKAHIYSKNSHFLMSYVGVLEQLRNPKVLWEALNEILCENPDFRKDFKLKWVGKVDDTIQTEWKATPLAHHIECLGYMPHQSAYQEMLKSDMLLITNFPTPQSKGIIPGKLFEYLSTNQPIISFGPQNADVELILKQTKAGQHFDYQNKEVVKQYILEGYHRWKSGLPHENNSDYIQQFSRKYLTKTLVELITANT